MNEKPLARMIDEAIADPELTLPAFNPVVLKLQNLIQSDDYTLKAVADLIQQDSALSAQILRVANSAFYSGLVPVSTVGAAAVRLGSLKLASIALLTTQKQVYKTRVKQFDNWLRALWRHSLGVALAAKMLAENQGMGQASEEAFMAGLLHDIGKVLLIRILDELLVKKSLGGSLTASLVKEILVDMHTKIGRDYLAGLNLPPIYLEVVEKHHQKLAPGDNPLQNTVRLGNKICHKLGIGLKRQPDLMLTTRPEAIHLMVNDIVLADIQVRLEEEIAALNSAL